MVRNLRLLKTILGDKAWHYFIFLIMATFIANLLECAGISLVFPVISVMVNPDFLTENAAGAWIAAIFHVRDAKCFICIALLLIGLSYLIKNLYLLALSYVRNRFVLNVQFELKKKVLFGFFYAPYIRFLDCSTSELVQAVEEDADGCVILMEKMLNIFGELLMLGLLGGIMLSVNAGLTVGVALLCGSIFFVFTYFFKPYTEKKSREYAAARKEFSKWLYQSIGNRKEIKAEQKEYFFLQNFHQFSEQACRIDAKVRFMQGLPRPIYEMCFVVCILGVLWFLISFSSDMQSAVAQLSVFGIAALRMLPGMLKLNQLLGTIFWHTPRLERTAERLKEQKENQQNGCVQLLHLKNELRLCEVSFSYPKSEQRIFDHVSMSIPAGKIIGISGLSGEGKTTLIDMIAGLLPASEGEILVDGKSLKEEENLMSWQAGVAYIPQNACLLHATIRENILFGSEDRGEQELWNVLEQAAADDFVKRLPDGLETIVGENGSRLSGGQGQRLVLARALYKNAQLLILDESTSALDAETEGMILKAIDRIRDKCTVLLVSHRPSTLKICDAVYRVEGGKVVRLDGKD